MSMFSKPLNASVSLRVLARLLSYPDAELLLQLLATREALDAERALGASRRMELGQLMDTLLCSDPMHAEAAYVALFDRGRATSLHLFEHVHGDSRDRGPAMIDLAQTYAKAGLYLAPGQLPDYLPVVLEFVSTQPPREARDFLAEMAHIFNAVFCALQERRGAYASVLGALLELAGGTAQAVKLTPEDPLGARLPDPDVPTANARVSGDAGIRLWPDRRAGAGHLPGARQRRPHLRLRRRRDGTPRRDQRRGREPATGLGGGRARHQPGRTRGQARCPEACVATIRRLTLALSPIPVAWYGDDFTGSTDVMEVLALNGLPSVFFLGTPDDAALERFRNMRAIGIADDARSHPPVWMDDHLAPCFRFLRDVGADLVHYKVCSTFDSSPHRGSIGRALEIGRATLGAGFPDLLRTLIERTGIERAIVAGGDTSSASGASLGIDALTFIAPTSPGSPLCRAYAQESRLDGISIVFKGGQVGGPGYFEAVRQGRFLSTIGDNYARTTP